MEKQPHKPIVLAIREIFSKASKEGAVPTEEAIKKLFVLNGRFDYSLSARIMKKVMKITGRPPKS